jgi:hypothetical protein
MISHEGGTTKDCTDMKNMNKHPLPSLMLLIALGRLASNLSSQFCFLLFYNKHTDY